MAQKWKNPDELVYSMDYTTDTKLTESFEDNMIIADVTNTDAFILYLDYTKGDEEKVQIKLEYSDYRENVDNIDFYAETIVINPNTGDLDEFFHTLIKSGKFRVIVHISGQEKWIRVSFKAIGDPVNSKLFVKHTTNNNRGRF